MSHDEFTKLFKYMEAFRAELEGRFDGVERDILGLKLNVAELSGRVEEYHDEFLALDHKVDRLERWTREIAGHTGTTLSPA